MEGHDTSKGNAGTSFSKLFNNNPVKAIPLSMETLALYIHELDLEAPEGAWETGDDFVAYLKQCKGAIPIKELFEKCLQENGIDYNIRELRKLTNRKNSGVRIISIGVGKSIRIGFLKCLSSDHDSYKINTMSELRDTFDEVANKLGVK